MLPEQETVFIVYVHSLLLCFCGTASDRETRCRDTQGCFYCFPPSLEGQRSVPATDIHSSALTLRVVSDVVVSLYLVHCFADLHVLDQKNVSFFEWNYWFDTMFLSVVEYTITKYIYLDEFYATLLYTWELYEVPFSLELSGIFQWNILPVYLEHFCEFSKIFRN